MGYISQAVTANGISAVLLLSLMLSFKRKFRSGEKDIKVFFWMLMVNLFQCIVEPITIILDGKMFTGAIALTTVLNSLLYIGNIIFAALWAMYASLRMRMYKHKKDTVLVGILKYLPMAVIIVGALINLFTPVFFRITENNIYERTGLFILPYVATYIYLVAGTVIAYGFAQRMERYVFLPAFTFLFPVVIASIFQYLLPPGFSLLWAGAAVGMASAYVTLLDESSSIDPLTGTFTRHYFNQHLRTLQGQSRGNKIVVGMMVDIDGFKIINDGFGHTVGDDALRNFGKILRKSCNYANAMVFRFGGDEFAILLSAENEDDIAELTREINERTKLFNKKADRPYLLQASVGYTVYRHGENPAEFVKRMDDAMYITKNSKKKSGI